jgi:hypothetical protein
MKKTLLIMTVILLFTFAQGSANSFGSGFGSFATANTSGAGASKILGGVGLADANTVFGILSYGLSDHTDGRIKFGIIDDNADNTELMFGADFIYNLISTEELKNGPFDMGFGGFFEYYDFNNASIWQFGGQFIGSYPLILSNESRFVPYGRVNVRIESLKSDFADDSNIEIGFNAGVEWEATKDINLFGEFQFDGNDGLFLGIQFRM